MTSPVNEETGHPPATPPPRIGPAGWSYHDWEGVVYPLRAGRDFDPLFWIARLFDFVEINVSFYRVPPPRQAESWARRIESTDLHFSAKIPRDFTHLRVPPTPAALRPFLDFLTPLADAGRLDVVLAQSPWSTRPGERTIETMRTLVELLRPHPVVHEVRHLAWADPRWEESLRAAGLDLVHVDQPALAQNLGPEFGPGRRAYVRLHGRNALSWFDPRAGRDARYDWLYSIEDLRAWAQRVRDLARTRTAVHVVTNNHFSGQAVVNAIELRALLGRPVASVPAGLFTRFEGLRERWETIGLRPDVLESRSTDPRPRSSGSGQGELFGNT